jgi:hypothetical protein
MKTDAMTDEDRKKADRAYGIHLIASLDDGTQMVMHIDPRRLNGLIRRIEAVTRGSG